MLSASDYIDWFKQNFTWEWVVIAGSIIASLGFIINLMVFINFEHEFNTPIIKKHSYNLPKIVTQGSWLKAPIFGIYVSNFKDLDISLSRLSYVVVGVMFSKNAKESQVVIRAEDGFDKVYHEGDWIEEGLQIKTITPQSVIILNHDKVEKLNLPKTILNFEQALKPLQMKE